MEYFRRNYLFEFLIQKYFRKIGLTENKIQLNLNLTTTLEVNNKFMRTYKQSKI